MNLNYSYLKTFAKVLITGLALYLLLLYYVSWNKNERGYVIDHGDADNSSSIDTMTFTMLNDVSDNDDSEIFVPPLSGQILEIHRRLNLTNPGHLGKPVVLPEHLPEDIQAEVNKSIDEFKFNEFVSRLIPLDRELPDYRKGTCKTANYSSNLPKVSVIMAFYNEPFSMVMRTIYSILRLSPPELIEEILLIDDCSDNGWSKYF